MYIVVNDGIPEMGFYNFEDAKEYAHINHLLESDIYLIPIENE